MMNHILLIGINYRLAPVEVRERLAFGKERVSPALQALAERFSPAELALLSTCNRTEVYIYCDDCECGLACVSDYLAQHAGLSVEALQPLLYIRQGPAAVQHLLRVAAGLDSLITGENEILGQVKDAYAQTLAAGVCGAHLAALFQHALQAGKRARAQAGIGTARQSAAWVVTALARQTFAPVEDTSAPKLDAFVATNTAPVSLAEHTALLIGAGKISSITARGLVQAGLRCVLVANRTYARAEKLAQALGGQAIHFDHLSDSLAQADIVICSTGAPHIVLHVEAVAAAMQQRPQRPLLVVDLAVPRDADPAIAAIPNVTLADIDDLQALCAPLSQEVRQAAEDVVAEELAAYSAWLEQRRSAALLTSLQQRVAGICDAQVQKTLRRLPGLPAEAEPALHTLAHAIASQLLHTPIQNLKTNPESETAFRDLFEV